MNSSNKPNTISPEYWSDINMAYDHALKQIKTSRDVQGQVLSLRKTHKKLWHMHQGKLAWEYTSRNKMGMRI